MLKFGARLSVLQLLRGIFRVFQLFSFSRQNIGLANLEEGVIFSAQAGPPAVQIVTEGARTDQTQAVLLGEILYAYDGVRHGSKS